MVSVEFGPSRSKRFGKALAEAESGPGECAELEPGRYRTNFLLDEDAAAYTGLARLLERVRHWRATDIHEDDEPVSVFHAKDIKMVDCPFRAGPVAVGSATGRSAAAEKERSRSNPTRARSSSASRRSA
jgi:hypothetical protein